MQNEAHTEDVGSNPSQDRNIGLSHGVAQYDIFHQLFGCGGKKEGIYTMLLKNFLVWFSNDDFPRPYNRPDTVHTKYIALVYFALYCTKRYQFGYFATKYYLFRLFSL